jgi:tripartite-type tricarboxylate transporter receptor subunit TctC
LTRAAGLRIALVSAMSLGLSCAFAATFPARPITIVVPYAVGGSTDVLARILAERLGRDLGQPVIVDNSGGAGGTIGTSKVIRASRDGHTILLHNMGIATAPALCKLSYDANKDLVLSVPREICR